MVFSSYSFLLLFLPLCLLLYFIVPQRLRSFRNAVLLLFSLVFYFFGEPKGIFVMLFIILLSYFCALLITRGRSSNARKLWLAVSVIGSLGILCIYKYSGLAVSTLNKVLRTSLSVPDIIMPIGISFFTFQSMSYVIDVYRGDAPAQKNPAYVALYVVMFPQLIAGPIVRYNTVAAAIRQREETLDDVYAGIRRFVVGLAKKVLLANTFGTVSETLFDLTGRSALLAWIGAVFYALQIFYDFSGYSDMAIGLGRVFGFRFLENFNYPYISKSITEFWRRWHISLGTWFRDYLYIPLGGNRKGLPRQILNLLIVWGLTGFWHGAGWNFLLWGLYFAVILIVEKLLLLKVLEKLPAFFRHLYALLLILIGWVIFNCTSLSSLTVYLRDLFRFSAVSTADFGYLWYLCRQFWPELICGILFCLPVLPALKKRIAQKNWYAPVSSILLLLLLVLCILSLAGSSFNPFIYFRF